MSTYNLNILINSIFKNSWIINLNKWVWEITKTVEWLTEKLSKTWSEFYAISELVKPLQKAISWAIKGSIDEFQDFEKQMSKVKAITWATDEQFQELNKIAKEMWATTAYTAKEAWDALEFLWMAWLSVQESMDALPWSLQNLNRKFIFLNLKI